MLKRTIIAVLLALLLVSAGCAEPGGTGEEGEEGEGGALGGGEGGEGEEGGEGGEGEGGDERAGIGPLAIGLAGPLGS